MNNLKQKIFGVITIIIVSFVRNREPAPLSTIVVKETERRWTINCCLFGGIRKVTILYTEDHIPLRVFSESWHKPYLLHKLVPIDLRLQRCSLFDWLVGDNLFITYGS